MVITEMKKVCIVFASAPRHMIMANIYFDYLKQNGIPYDVIYMNKYDEDENTGAEVNYPVSYKKKNKLQKLFGFFKFGKEASSILKKNKYGFVIVWSEYTAAFICRVLKKEYKQRYCVNVRDLNVGLRQVLNIPLNSAIKSSLFTTVSSEKYIPELTHNFDNYLFFHSYNQKVMDETLQSMANSEKKPENNDKIRILYIGYIRFYDHLIKFIEQIKNDPRYELTVAGSGSESIKSYIEKNGITNVVVHGKFPKEQTGEFLADADVIFNLYGTEDLNLKYALSNKLYYAVALGLPILVYKNTYVAELAEKCGIAFAVDDCLDGSFADKFYDWYTTRDFDEIKLKCNEFLKDAIRSQDELRSRMDEVKNQLLEIEEN